MKLDIGCGDQSIKYAEDYVCIDIDWWPLYDGHPELNAEIIADARYLPFKDEAFEAIHSGACIGMHVGKEAFDEAVRVLAPNGTFRIRIDEQDLALMLAWLQESKLSVADISPSQYEDEVLITSRKSRGWYRRNVSNA